MQSLRRGIRILQRIGGSGCSASPNTLSSGNFISLKSNRYSASKIIDKETAEEVKAQRDIPDIRPAHIIQLKVEAPENKMRVFFLKGIVVARLNAGLNTAFRPGRLVAGVGVKSLFPLYSPSIKEIEVPDKKKMRMRGTKLYCLREKMNALKRQWHAPKPRGHESKPL